MGGSSRQGVAQGIAAQGINNSLLTNQSNIANQNYNQDYLNRLNIAQQADTNQVSKQNLLTNMIAGQQNAMSGGLSAAGGVQGLSTNNTAAANNPLQWLQSYIQGVGAPTVLGSGSSTGSSYGSSQGSGSNGGGGFCYITTAVTQALGEPDDGPTLTKLRKFRDEYMCGTQDRVLELRDYYATAPALVAAIDKRPRAKHIYEEMNLLYLQPAVRAIDSQNYPLAHNMYKRLVKYAQRMANEEIQGAVA